MKKLLLLVCFAAAGLDLGAQAPKVKYWTKNFYEGPVKIDSNIVYGRNRPYPYECCDTSAAPSPQDLLLDLYYVEDPQSEPRPLIILVHAGSFQPPSVVEGGFGLRAGPGGRKNDNWIVDMATDLAKRGFVVASMDHRVGWDAIGCQGKACAQSVFKAVLRAQQDMRACIRYLRRPSIASQYKIDVNRIAVGGSSSGAYVGIHSQVLDNIEEVISVDKFLDDQGVPMVDSTKIGDLNGVMQTQPAGSSLQASDLSISSRVQAIISFGGAVGDTTFLDPGDPPIIAVHGVEDATTPYNTAIVITAALQKPIIEVSGGLDMVRVAAQKGNQNIFRQKLGDAPYSVQINDETTVTVHPGLKLFPGEGFEFYNWWSWGDPTRTDPARTAKAQNYLRNDVMYFMLPRLLAALDLEEALQAAVGRDDAIVLQNALSVFPNPADDQLVVALHDSKYRLQKIELYNALGQKVWDKTCDRTAMFEASVGDLPAGVYHLRVVTNAATVGSKFIKR
ncbi:MAG: T9SS type A sorting domain-containing protein [Bacteroidia bacterium]|nr:T9SS type A sorting domain-containing protein [Bacteroidia bacterium]